MEMMNNLDYSKNFRDMTYDILVSIFSTFHIMDVVMRFSNVCPEWDLACADPFLWKTLDLTVLGDYIPIPPPNAWSEESSNLLQRILRYTLNLSGGNIKKLIFNFTATIDDGHLQLAVENCPKLQHLVLPPSKLISKKGIKRALRMRGSSLKSMAIPFITLAGLDVLDYIGEYCHNLKALKFSCCLSVEIAMSLVRNLPFLKTLSLRGSVIDKMALDFLLDNMVNLEALNITHSLVIRGCCPAWSQIILLPVLPDSTLEKASRLSIFYNCDKNECDACDRKYSDLNRALDEMDGALYHELGEEFWRDDEIKSLAY